MNTIRVRRKPYKKQQRKPAVPLGNVNAITIAVPGINALGKLEGAIMNAVWNMVESGQYNSVTVADICSYMRPYRKYTSVLCSMAGLIRKGLLIQLAPEDRKYVYAPAISRAGYEDRIIGATMNVLRTNHPEAIERYDERVKRPYDYASIIDRGVPSHV